MSLQTIQFLDSFPVLLVNQIMEDTLRIEMQGQVLLPVFMIYLRQNVNLG